MKFASAFIIIIFINDGIFLVFIFFKWIFFSNFDEGLIFCSVKSNQMNVSPENFSLMNGGKKMRTSNIYEYFPKEFCARKLICYFQILGVVPSVKFESLKRVIKNSFPQIRNNATRPTFCRVSEVLKWDGKTCRGKVVNCWICNYFHLKNHHKHVWINKTATLELYARVGWPNYCSRTVQNCFS